MIHTKKITKEVDEITDIICDCCGKTCKTNTGFEHMKLHAYWGYHSNGKDLEEWSAQICETCVDEKFGFIKFNKKGYNLL